MSNLCRFQSVVPSPISNYPSIDPTLWQCQTPLHSFRSSFLHCPNLSTPSFPTFFSNPSSLSILLTNHQPHGDHDGIRPVWSVGGTTLMTLCSFRVSSSRAVCLSPQKEFFSVSALSVPFLGISFLGWWLIFSGGRLCLRMRCFWWSLLPYSRWVRTQFMWMSLLLLSLSVLRPNNQIDSLSVTQSAFHTVIHMAPREREEVSEVVNGRVGLQLWLYFLSLREGRMTTCESDTPTSSKLKLVYFSSIL